jgi:flagellar motility protein MotE (MotC chaperone)
MAAHVRILQVVMAASLGALAFKGVDVAQAVAQQAAKPEAAPAETALTTGASMAPQSGPNAEGPAAAAPAATPATAPAAASSEACANPDYSESGISAQEINVLRSLADRRQALDEREAGIETREQAAAAAETRLQDQIGQLKSLEGEMQKLLASMDAKKDERMGALIKTYEAMKPKDAANIFNGMDDKVLIDLAKSMKPATLAVIMQAMDAKRAQQLTKMLADLAQLPPNIEALKKTTG